jgi:PadR family transcriptional regulator PadR
MGVWGHAAFSTPRQLHLEKITLDIPRTAMYSSARYSRVCVHWRCEVLDVMEANIQINKDLIAASSTPIVLAILAEGDSYGYAIIKRVRELSGGRMEWTDGMLYPVLHRLERLGHIESRWETAESGRRRKYYRITPSGRTQLAEQRKQWETVEETMRNLWSALQASIPAGHPEPAGAFSNGG